MKEKKLLKAMIFCNQCNGKGAYFSKGELVRCKKCEIFTVKGWKTIAEEAKLQARKWQIQFDQIIMKH